jgi:glyoxylase-like metal-dependent hydrolase (beta-lactamase superfamily II)
MTELTFDRNFDAVPGEVEEVSPLIRRVLANNPSPFTFKGTSSFIVGRGHVAVIDPGPDDEGHLNALLQAARGETVTHIFVTHTHVDHSPLAFRLKAATGAEICAAGVAADSGVEGGVRLDAKIDWSFKPDVSLTHGAVMSGKGWSLEAVFTPGHLYDHMCFALLEERALFCGDHVMAWATSVIAPPEGNMADYMKSLRLLLKRNDQVLHPAHGPSRADPKPLVRAYLAHRRMREEAILKRVRDGDRRIADIVRAIYADVDPRLHGAAALSTRAHLDHLVAQGKVRQSGDGYEAVGSR